MRRLARQFFRGALAVAGVFAVVVFIELALQSLLGQSHPIASWAVQQFSWLFRPIGDWFVHAPAWAWVSMILVLNVPAAILLTWALHVAGLGLKQKYWLVWLVLFWGVLVTMQYAVIGWARSGGGF